MIFLLVRGRCFVRRIFTPVMSAAPRLLEDNTPSMSRGRLAVHQELPFPYSHRNIPSPPSHTVTVRGLLGLGDFFCRGIVISPFPAYPEGIVMRLS